MRSIEEAQLSSDPLPICEDEVDIEKQGDIKGPKIELRNVWFQYPTRDIPVLQGLNMTVEMPHR